MRVTTTKSKNAESFYINYSFIDKNGKNTSKVYKKLGTLKELQEKLGTDRDGVMAWAKEQARIATEEYNSEKDSSNIMLSPTKLIGIGDKRTFNVGYLFLQNILADLRIDNICRNISNKYRFKYDISAVFTDLIYSRILSPSSKLSSYDYCSKYLLEPPKYSIDDVYNALSVLSKEMDYIQSEIYRNSNFVCKRNTSVLYYDCSNYYFEIEQEDKLRKYGKSKEHRPNPIVGMGLFMDGDGIPLAFSIYPGNMNEQLTLKPLEEKIIKDFGCTQFIYCSDSGLGSTSNKKYNNTDNRSYVVTQSLKKLKEDTRKTALDTAQYRKVGSKEFIDLKDLDEEDENVFNSIYYKEVPVEKGSLSETMLVTYSPKYKKYQQTIRQGQINRARKMINTNGKIKKVRKNPNDPARFIDEIAVTNNGEVAEGKSYVIDENKILEEEKYDGFYAVVTDLDLSVDEIVAINKNRWEIEECFRIMKTDFKARPVYVSRQDSIEAHFLTCFMALLVYRLLEKKLEHKYTINQIVGTLREMKVVDLSGQGYVPAYTRSEITDALHGLVDFRTDTEIIKKKKMRTIIKKSKERQ